MLRRFRLLHLRLTSDRRTKYHDTDKGHANISRSSADHAQAALHNAAPPLAVSHIRSVRVAIDKPGFIVAPTSCSTQQIGATRTADARTRRPVRLSRGRRC